MTDDTPGADLDDRRLLHQFKNYLAVIVGFCDLLLNELTLGDPKHADVVEVRKAAQSAMLLLPELSRRLD
jgi:hypothetical protein